MGNCVTVKNSRIVKTTTYKQQPILTAAGRKNLSTGIEQLGHYTIVNNSGERVIQFRNAPLTNNDYLFNKFHHDGNRPDQVNLSWQIAGIQLTESDLLRISVINTVPIRMWIVTGGKEKKTITGLYLEIQKYSFASMLQLKSISNLQQKNISQIKLDRKVHYKQKIKVILQSVSNPNHSLYLVNTYERTGAVLRLERQELMWNSLGFQLENIYNQHQQIFNENDIKNKGANQEISQREQFLCVICQQEPSTCILVPCKHMCIGRGCINNFRKMYKSCPLCKREFQEIIIYREITH